MPAHIHFAILPTVYLKVQKTMENKPQRVVIDTAFKLSNTIFISEALRSLTGHGRETTTFTLS